MEVPSASRLYSSGVGGSSISYADVATFEVGLGGPISKHGLCSTMRSGSPITVCNPLKVDLSSSAEKDVSCYLDVFQKEQLSFSLQVFGPLFLSCMPGFLVTGTSLRQPISSLCLGGCSLSNLIRLLIEPPSSGKSSIGILLVP